MLLCGTGYKKQSTMSFAIYLLQAVAFLDLLAVGLIVPLVASHVRDMGGNHLYVGLLGSIYAGFQLGSGPLIGSLSDLKGRKTILILTLLVCGIAYTVLGLTSSILVILLIRAVLGTSEKIFVNIHIYIKISPFFPTE